MSVVTYGGKAIKPESMALRRAVQSGCVVIRLTSAGAAKSLTKDRIVWRSAHRDVGLGVVAVAPSEVASLKPGQYAAFRFGLDLVPASGHKMICKGFPLNPPRAVVKKQAKGSPSPKGRALSITGVVGDD